MELIKPPAWGTEWGEAERERGFPKALSVKCLEPSCCSYNLFDDVDDDDDDDEDEDEDEDEPQDVDEDVDEDDNDVYYGSTRFTPGRPLSVL